MDILSLLLIYFEGLTIILLLIFMKMSGAFEIIKQKLFPKNHILLILFDNRGGFSFKRARKLTNITGELEFYFLNPSGFIYASPGTTRIHRESGVNASLAYIRYGATVSPEMVLATQILKQNKNIRTIEELEEEFKKHGLDHIEIQPIGYTFAIENLIGFFKYMINPAMLFAFAKRCIAAGKAGEGIGGLSSKTIFLIIVVVMIVFFALIIFLSIQKSGGVNIRI